MKATSEISPKNFSAPFQGLSAKEWLSSGSNGPNGGSCPGTSGDMCPVCSIRSQAFNGEWLQWEEQGRYKATGGCILPVYERERGGRVSLYQETLNLVSSTGQDMLKGDGPGEWSITGNDCQYSQGCIACFQTHCLICCLGANLLLMSCGSGCFSLEPEE